MVEGGSFNNKMYRMAPESRLAADETLVANQAVEAETVNAAAAPRHRCAAGLPFAQML